ncbi:MAG: chitinase, partial [Arcobacter sp.]|nr:chitinase [Arcobacter sp.]
NRIGNGDVASGDGWKYRGRGGKQLTGKSNYKGFKLWHTKTFNEEIDFVSTPNLLGEAKYAARSAAYFWLAHSLYDIADKGIENKQINAITNIINLYDSDDGKKERRNNVKKIYKVLSTN